MVNCPKCNTPIKEHPANAYLDALFTEEVMEQEVEERWCKNDLQCGDRYEVGFLSEKEIQDEIKNYWYKPYKCFCWKDGHGNWWPIKEPSTNISHAMEGVDYVQHKDEDIRFQFFTLDNEWVAQVYPAWRHGIEVSAPLKKLELAITRALILWAMEKKQNENM